MLRTCLSRLSSDRVVSWTTEDLSHCKRRSHVSGQRNATGPPIATGKGRANAGTCVRGCWHVGMRHRWHGPKSESVQQRLLCCYVVMLWPGRYTHRMHPRPTAYVYANLCPYYGHGASARTRAHGRLPYLQPGLPQQNEEQNSADARYATCHCDEVGRRCCPRPVCARRS